MTFRFVKNSCLELGELAHTLDSNGNADLLKPLVDEFEEGDDSYLS